MVFHNRKYFDFKAIFLMLEITTNEYTSLEYHIHDSVTNNLIILIKIAYEYLLQVFVNFLSIVGQQAHKIYRCKIWDFK